MSGLKTIFTSTLLAATLMAPAPSLLAQSSQNDHLRVFAACAGRLSAQMKFQWMFDGEAADATKSSRSALLDILDAMMSPDQGRMVLNWRVEAKAAQARLLTRATFNDDKRDAQMANRMAVRMIGDCRAMLLS